MPAMPPADQQYNSILLFGAPGVGKGTQGKLLGKIPGLHHLATGDIFRSLNRETELGRQFYEYSSRGELVPDDLTIQLWLQHMHALIAQRVYSPSTDLLILDGMPRTTAQAEALDEHINVLKIVHLTTPNVEEMVLRMKRRALRENRPDDADESVIRRRFEVYMQETRPVRTHYDPSLIAEVNGVGTPAEVLMNILQVLVPIYNNHFTNPLAG
jgi:adenylate kinase